MDALKTVLDLFLHLDEHLKHVIEQFGLWTYAILFLIIFCETGLVVTPFLPGDSLLFAAGAMSALYPESLHIVPLLVLLSIAAILGDTVNYALGRWIGPRAFSGKLWFLKQEHLVKAQVFYDKYGGKTIIIARFVPIVRTFAPFVAGIGKMNYRLFLYYNIVGGIFWVVVCAMAGYLFGNIPFVKENFEFFCLGIVFVSVLPMGIEILLARRHKAAVTLPAVAHPQPPDAPPAA